MPFQSLSTALTSKPLVLAGPVLRKVTAKEVTVWVVTRKPATVALKVMESASDNQLMADIRHTVAVGDNLHIIAVTAKLLAPVAAELSEGRIYLYDLEFELDDGQRQTLAEATASASTPSASLAYPPFDKPSFCLPPADINKLRLVHGSCRKPHGNGTDALPMLDDLIRQGADNPSVRPHQLLLNGDQIYADDVAFSMSMMLMDASEALLGWTEEFICNVPGTGTRRKITELHPGLRSHIVVDDAGFTSVDFLGQLIGLGEYLSMYLFVWSDVLWPAAPATLPDFNEIRAFFSSRFDSADAKVLPGGIRLFERHRGGVNAHTARVADFGRTVKEVRRALANIPTYMIFDDHEITDDWNMTRNFCKRVYGSPLGLRIVQNGLVAYALCQHWGNAPEQFLSPSSVSPGAKLLPLLDGTSAARYDTDSPVIRGLLGVQEDSVLATRPDNGLFHDAGSFTYNYAIEAPGHQVIVTDTRSWRSYPRGPNEGGDFLPSNQLRDQIANTLPVGNRVLLIVLSTNAPPTQPIRTLTRYPSVAPRVAGSSPDIYEAWDMPRKATDRLLKAISDKMPLVEGLRQGRVILLSGDVHHSFASRMLFKGTTRFEDPQNTPQPVSMVYAQLVSSSLRNQDEKTEGLHRDGYDYDPSHVFVPDNKPEGYIGWNVPSGVKKQVAKYKNNPGSGGSFTPIEANGPKTLSIWDAKHGVVAEVPPDYSYRLDYLLAVPRAPLPDVTPGTRPMPGDSPDDRRRAAEAFRTATTSYREFNQAWAIRQEVVGVNNIGEVTFDWDAADAKVALHTLHWRDPVGASDRFTTYVCSLNPDDTAFPELKPLLP